MRSSPECLRLCLALLLSAVLHAALLLPSRYAGTGRGSAPEPGATGTTLVARIAPGQPTKPLAGSAASAQAPDQPSTPAAPAAGTAPPDEGRFFSTPELSRAPRPIDDVDLDIPEAALVTRSGTFVLTLRIDAKGQVVAYEVEAPGLPEEFTTALAETFRAARFVPGEIAGHKVGSVLKVEISIDAATPGERR